MFTTPNSKIKSWDDLDYWSSEDWNLVQERMDEAGDRLVPSRERVFAALDLCPWSSCRVVILGQDPYPDPDQAMGLAFSVPKGAGYRGSSLDNIFRELCTDLKYRRPSSGDLTYWAEQGVLLWNAIPTGFKNRTLAHSKWEWKSLTLELVERCSERGCVFILMGMVARNYLPHISSDVLVTGHPSPLAVNNPKKSSHNFIGSRIFSTTNALLVARGKEPIDWLLI